MKRLIFCFDGTWNKLNESTPTNVVLLAASIQRVSRKGVPQLVHYDEGVGTGKIDRAIGGMFGSGLVTNVREAYRFLIFNYDPGDEIYVFGFSRGAFSARTFIGLLRHVGPLRRLHAGRIDEAMKQYRDRHAGKNLDPDIIRKFRAAYADGVCVGPEDDRWRCENVEGYGAGSAPSFDIRYLGVWDTVGALGVPEAFPGGKWLNRRHRYHDTSIDGFVRTARHAVALDERRILFPPVQFNDCSTLNLLRGFEPSDDKAPYQEQWFPGVHGSVGGGGDIRGLSDETLAWVLKGAKIAGLELDTEKGTRIHGFQPDPLAPLVNFKKPTFSATNLLRKDRQGPEHGWQVSASAARRWATAASKVGGSSYRPASLSLVKDYLDSIPDWTFEAPTELLAVETVTIGDTLSKYALKHYGQAKLWKTIYMANRDTVLDPDDIFPGQTIRIPTI